MRKNNILVTGLSGVIGSAVITHLKDKYNLTALNRGELRGLPCHRADIANLEDIKPVFQGNDAVVHLAAFIGDTSWETTLNTNLIGTYNVFEAARGLSSQRSLRYALLHFMVRVRSGERLWHDTTVKPITSHAFASGSGESRCRTDRGPHEILQYIAVFGMPLR